LNDVNTNALVLIADCNNGMMITTTGYWITIVIADTTNNNTNNNNTCNSKRYWCNCIESSFVVYSNLQQVVLPAPVVVPMNVQLQSPLPLQRYQFSLEILSLFYYWINRLNPLP
jgi:hypothetical protein